MSVLKRLRESRNLSFEGLAEKIDASPEDIEEWEKGLKPIPKNIISGLAYCFGLSSEELRVAINGCTSRITTNNYYIYGDKNNEDGWWGHFGIRLNGHVMSKWFPITLGMANEVSNKLANINSRDEWIIVETLNNRILVFKPATAKRLWLLDDAQDQPDDDWDIPWDGYSGRPGEFYKALEEYYWEGVDIDSDEEISSIVRKEVEAFTDIHDLDLEQIRKLIFETQVYNIDGSEFSLDVDGSKLVEIINSIEFELPQLILDVSNDSFDLYIPTDNISLIDMPRRCVDAAIRDGEEEVKDL